MMNLLVKNTENLKFDFNYINYKYKVLWYLKSLYKTHLISL